MYGTHQQSLRFFNLTNNNNCCLIIADVRLYCCCFSYYCGHLSVAMQPLYYRVRRQNKTPNVTFAKPKTTTTNTKTERLVVSRKTYKHYHSQHHCWYFYQHRTISSNILLNFFKNLQTSLATFDVVGAGAVDTYARVHKIANILTYPYTSTNVRVAAGYFPH